MISYTQQQNVYTDLSQNLAPTNVTRGSYLMNIEHRYLLQKYFNNEGSYSISTIGNNVLTVTTAPQVNAVAATLSVVWGFPTCRTVVTFSDSEVREVLFTNASTAITWSVPLTGTQYLTTAIIPAAATSATLQSAWSTATQTTTAVFSDGSTKSITFTQGSATISWTGGLTAPVSAYVYTSVMTTSLNVGGVQFYRLPPNYSKLKDVTLTVGNLKWTLDEIRTREDWDKLNVFPYYANIPKNFFIYPGGDKGGLIGIWPIPSSTGNIITFNYKFRIPDLSLTDYGSLTYVLLTGALQIGDTINQGAVTGFIDSYTASNISLRNTNGTFTSATFTTGNGAGGTVSSVSTVSVTNGSSTVTGTGTVLTPTVNQQLESRWIKFSQPQGDGLWYQIQSVDSTTQITLWQPYQGSTITNSTGYTIGQMLLLPEDFQDMLLWKALVYYFSSIAKDIEKAKEFQAMYDNKKELLSEYSGSNTVQVNLSRKFQQRNPNLYPYNTIG